MWRHYNIILENSSITKRPWQRLAISDNLNLLSAYVIWNILVLNIKGKVNKIAINTHIITYIMSCLFQHQYNLYWTSVESHFHLSFTAYKILFPWWLDIQSKVFQLESISQISLFYRTIVCFLLYSCHDRYILLMSSYSILSITLPFCEP